MIFAAYTRRETGFNHNNGHLSQSSCLEELEAGQGLSSLKLEYQKAVQCYFH